MTEITPQLTIRTAYMASPPPLGVATRWLLRAPGWSKMARFDRKLLTRPVTTQVAAKTSDARTVKEIALIPTGTLQLPLQIPEQWSRGVRTNEYPEGILGKEG